MSAAHYAGSKHPPGRFRKRVTLLRCGKARGTGGAILEVSFFQSLTVLFL